MNTDKIVVLEKGKLIEEGTHNQLYIEGTKYYNLRQKQNLNHKNSNLNS